MSGENDARESGNFNSFSPDLQSLFFMLFYHRLMDGFCHNVLYLEFVSYANLYASSGVWSASGGMERDEHIERVSVRACGL